MVLQMIITATPQTENIVMAVLGKALHQMDCMPGQEQLLPLLPIPLKLDALLAGYSLDVQHLMERIHAFNAYV